jgi:sterol desaturase/sphingolipid hydroxylase (fatty acid hydroxylase superfamily)
MWILMNLVLFALGALGWTFTEYAMHNWVGHMGKGRNEFSREHLAHHARQHYFTPTPKKLLTAFAVLTPMFLLFSWPFGWVGSGSFTVGFGLCYFAYEWLHRRLHTHPPQNWYGRWARKHHFYHHFGNPKFNHGVTTPIWDWVFRTYKTPEQIRVPEQLAMTWVFDHDTRVVHPQFSDDYFLAVKKSRRAVAA